jgi:hypothetical protein
VQLVHRAVESSTRDPTSWTPLAPRRSSGSGPQRWTSSCATPWPGTAHDPEELTRALATASPRRPPPESVSVEPCLDTARVPRTPAPPGQCDSVGELPAGSVSDGPGRRRGPRRGRRPTVSPAGAAAQPGDPFLQGSGGASAPEPTARPCLDLVIPGDLEQVPHTRGEGVVSPDPQARHPPAHRTHVVEASAPGAGSRAGRGPSEAPAAGRWWRGEALSRRHVSVSSDIENCARPSIMSCWNCRRKRCIKDPTQGNGVIHCARQRMCVPPPPSGSRSMRPS